MLIIKTKTDQIEVLKEMVLRTHPYDVPEFIALPIEHGSEPYLKWIEKQVGEPDPSSIEAKQKNVDRNSSSVADVGSD
uniref:Uncharacterized protein n=1 Tax=Ditylenchus dipsaci TaxID=166011 RepID=A0A915D8K9_9BILA